MRTLFCGAILLFSILAAIFAKRDCDENGNTKFNSDWFWMGSNLRSLGKAHADPIICYFNYFEKRKTVIISDHFHFR